MDRYRFPNAFVAVELIDSLGNAQLVYALYWASGFASIAGNDCGHYARFRHLATSPYKFLILWARNYASGVVRGIRRPARPDF